ncbi:MAG: phosphoenolpyruvate--protein phosphotransferase [Clostridia bacterium]|nr:phosphoenolpyruvate--protein phosphotransferase [Clostridia bacterium]
MLTLQGKGVSGGVAIGRVRLLHKQEITVTQDEIADTEAEWRRYETARDRTVSELEKLYEWSCEEIGQENARIFSVHAMIAQDEDFNQAVREGIVGRHNNAEYAVTQAARQFAAVFADMEDAYMRERASDVEDIARRMLGHLAAKSGQTEAEKPPARAGEGDIICAVDLTPGETVQLDRRRVSAFVTAQGSANSHTAILSRTMDLPAVVGIGKGFEAIYDGAVVAVDADNGRVYVDPDAATLHTLRLRIEQNAHARTLLQQYRGRESRTPDGQRIEICANIGGVEDMDDVIRNDADGVGLFRSEFLYLGREDFPTEEEQFEAYRYVLERMPGKRVVVRTLDIGADKQAAYFGLAPEENSALGLRAVRISLTYPEVFLTQARALLRASYYGRLAVMFPLVTSTEEVKRLKALWERAAADLRERGVPCAEQIEIGIMIETPAAAIISDRLAPLVDFFSIGSNDLIQYTLAMDRQNAALEEFCDTHHEAVLRLIRHTVQNARRAGIWVGVCGELGADLDLTEEFLRMGIDELSVAPAAVLPLRRRVCTARTEGRDKQEDIREGGKA